MIAAAIFALTCKAGLPLTLVTLALARVVLVTG